MAGETSDMFSEREPHRNVALKVEDRLFWVSREMLSEHSTVFKAMFYGLFQESTLEVIELPGKNAEDILEMLRCLFPKNGFYQSINADNVVTMIALGDEYDIEVLQRRCEEYYTVLMPEGHRVIKDLFLHGVQYGKRKIIRDCLPLMARFPLAQCDEVLAQLSNEVRSALYLQTIGQLNGHRDDYLKSGHRCHNCNELSEHKDDEFGGIMDIVYCRCLAPAAIKELEKVGL